MTGAAPPWILPADRCWYCGEPFVSPGQMLAVAQNVGNHLAPAIRWVCRERVACGERCQVERKKGKKDP